MAMIICKKCKAQVSTTARICPICGESLKKPLNRWIIAAIILGLLYFIGSIEKNNRTGPTHSISKVSYDEIKAVVKDNSLTDAQLHKKLSRYKGIYIKWTGRVFEAKQGLTKKYEIWIDIDGKVQDVILNTTEKTMLSVNRNDVVTFVGKITKVDKFLGNIWVYADLDMIQ